MNRKLKLLLPASLFIALLAVFAIGLQHDPRELPSTMISRDFPSFNLPTLFEQPPVNNAVLKQEVKLVNIWASWCYACRKEHGELLKLKQQGVKIIGINYKDQPNKARQYLSKLGNPYDLVIVDASGRLGMNLGVYGTPETYLVDAQGVIRYRHVGVLNAKTFAREFQPRIAQLRSGS